MPLILLAADGAGVGQSAAGEVVAEEDNGGVAIGLAEVDFEQAQGRLERFEGGRAAIAEEEDLIDRCRGRRAVLRVVV